MRRVRLLIVIVAVAVIVAVLLPGGSRSYRFDAIFDSAKGMVPGQLIKIAGVPVGSVVGVKLAPGPTARMQFSINARYGPFHTNARCQIEPEGFISENFVECDPGSPDAPLLRSSSGGGPTVPLSQTAVPVSLQDVINIFSLPVDERVQVLINELGIATAGRGEDINAILRRANPALTQAQHVLSIIAGQNQRVAAAVGQTDQIVSQLAHRSDAVRAFVDNAATVAETTAAHRSSLAATVQRLPPLLSALRSGLRSIDRVAENGSPLLDELQASAPGLLAATHTLPAFTGPALPAIRAVGTAANEGRVAIHAATPVVADLKALGTTAPPIVRSLAELLVSMRDKGAIEHLLQFIYSLATDTAGYDSISHIVSIYAGIYPQCLADNTAAGCSHDYSAPGQGQIPVNDPTNASAVSRTTGPTTGQLHALLQYLLK